MLYLGRLLLLAALPLALAEAADFDAAHAANAVGLELFRKLAVNQPGENLVLSPYSIESALALAYAGADGDTRREMAAVLRFPPENTPLQTGFAELRAALEQLAEQTKPIAAARSRDGGRVEPLEWRAANRLFGQQGYAFRAPFVALMKDGFAAPFEPLDFRADAERSRGIINAWVEDQTRHKIKELVPRGALTDGTRLVLVNALYLKATWETPFEKYETESRPFHASSSRVRDVPTMHRTAYLGHAVDDGFTAVALDYLGRGLQFLIMLPAEGESADAAVGRLTPEHLARWAKLGDGCIPHVSLYLPKFRVEGVTVRLGETLRALGLTSAFDQPRGSANFDRIAPRTPSDYLAISDVFHQTFIAVDEEGTEAAAATAVAMVTFSAAVAAAKPIEVRVNRPFLFAVQHRASGACLFLGRIAEPR